MRSQKSSRALVKSVSRSEARTLRKLACRYAEHMLGHPESLLMRIWGFFALSETEFFILIENVLDFGAPVAALFDVKGSVVHRTAEAGKSVLLDCNWQKEGHCVLLAPATRQRVLQQLSKDVKLLEETNLMDYSLLIGIVNERDGSFVKEGCFHRVFEAADGGCVYLLGVIDFLQEYNLKKKLAHRLKRR